MVLTMYDCGTYPLVISEIMLFYLCLSPLQQGLKWRLLSGIIFINIFLMLIAHVVFMFQNAIDLALMGSSCTTVSASIQTASKIFLLNWHKKQLALIWEIIKKDFWPADLTDTKTKYSIRYNSRLILIMVSVYLSSAFLSAWDYMAIHLVYGRRILPLESYFPFKWDISPRFELITIWQFILHMYIIIHTIATHDFFFNALVTNCIAQFKLLHATLQTIGTGEDILINEKLNELDKLNNKHSKTKKLNSKQYDLIKKCVEHHNKIIYVCKKIQEVYGIIILLQFFLSALSLCVSTFVLTNYENYLTKMLSFAVAHLIQFFFLCAIANDLIFQSAALADAVYSSKWYKSSDLQLRRALILIIQRSRREVKISALGFADLDYPNFVNVLRFSFSVYTLLSSLNEKS